MDVFTDQEYADYLGKKFPKGMHCPFCGCRRWGLGDAVVLKSFEGAIHSARYIFCANCGFVAMRDEGIVAGNLEYSLREKDPARFINRRMEVSEEPKSSSTLCDHKKLSTLVRIRLRLRALAGWLLYRLLRP